MLARVFADGQIDPDEKAELEAMWKSGGLTKEQVHGVMKEFMARTLSHITADKVVTEAEKQKLRLIVTELEIPNECIPDEARKLLAG
jgi:hypothetical protein